MPKDVANLDSMKPAMEKLSPEEKELLAGYVVRHTLGSALGTAFGGKGDPIPDGMTMGKAIDEQKAFIAKAKADEANRKAAIEKAQAERKALATQLAQLVGVHLLNISLHKASFRDMDVQSRIDLTFEFENKGAKEIAGIKGVATFRDKFGDAVSTLPLKMQQVIGPGAMTKIVLSKNFNQFDADDRKLANIEASDVKLELAPEVVLFTDGTKFEAPKAAVTD